MIRWQLFTRVTASIIAACCASMADAQSNTRAKADFRAFNRISDMFADFDDWHGPVTNLGIAPQISWTRDTGENTNVVTGSLAMSSYTWITPTLTTIIDLSIDQVSDPARDETLIFNGEGLGLDDMYFLWSDQRVGLQGGIFTVPFGTAWNTLPGVFDTTLVSDYQFDGRVGGIASLSTGNTGGGVHELQAGIFTIDGSFLSKTVMTGSGPAETDDVVGGDGGASWVVTYAASELSLIAPSFGYQVGFISQSAATSDGPRENAISASFEWTLPLDGDTDSTVDARFFSVTPSFEYVHFADWQGVDGASADYYTPGLSFNYGDWEMDFAATWTNGDDGTALADAVLLSTTLSYTFFSPQTQLQFGYAYQETNGVPDHLIGVQINMPINVLSYGLLGR